MFPLNPPVPLRSRGFSLLELLIVLALVGILSAFSYPTYQHHVRETQRRQAMAHVLALSQQMEKHRALTYAYPSHSIPTEQQDSYIFSVLVKGEGYSITATPVPNSDQRHDRCGVFRFTSEGAWIFLDGLSFAECR